MNKKEMIEAILLNVKANGAPITGELFFSLAFRSESELKKICSELCISTSK